MDAFRTYKLYTGVNLHFKRDSFDIFENGGNLKGKVETFNKRRDAKIFYALASQWNAPNFIIMVAANNMYGNHACAYDRETAEQNYKEYEKRRQAITRVFTNDLNQIDDPLNEQELIQKMMGGKITIETCVILHEMMGLFNGELPKIFEPVVRRIRKSVRFVRYDKRKIEQVLRATGYLNEV